jgi:hypothetical protein
MEKNFAQKWHEPDFARITRASITTLRMSKALEWAYLKLLCRFVMRKVCSPRKGF